MYFQISEAKNIEEFIQIECFIMSHTSKESLPEIKLKVGK